MIICLISSSYEEDIHDQNILIQILRSLGFYINFKNLCSPTQDIRFLGIHINSVTLEMQMLDEKLGKLLTQLTKFKDRRKVTRRELEKLGGSLAHCSKVI